MTWPTPDPADCRYAVLIGDNWVFVKAAGAELPTVGETWKVPLKIDHLFAENN